MGMNDTPSNERTQIGIFGNRNAGKSTLINAITNQDLAVVSNVAGTTTDPVKKAMEILPLGPVVLIDTPGLDDEGDLGHMRVEKTKQALRQCHIAILVLDNQTMFTDIDSPEIKSLIEITSEKGVPLITVINKVDQSGIVFKKSQAAAALGTAEDSLFFVSALEKTGIDELKEAIARVLPNKQDKPLVSDLLKENEGLILVIPIDESAPKGRIILPQQAVIRDALEVGAQIYICKDDQYAETLKQVGHNTSLVVTDSQAFNKIKDLTPDNVRLTSFSILMARKKGDLEQQVAGAKCLSKLQDGARILISEGCTHHRQCNDIGTVKLPNWIKEFTGKNFEYQFTSGGEFPEDLSSYDLIVHCGGCTLNPKEMKYRMTQAKNQQIKITNYGVLIAYMNGILDRCMEVFEI